MGAEIRQLDFHSPARTLLLQLPRITMQLTKPNLSDAARKNKIGWQKGMAKVTPTFDAAPLFRIRWTHILD